MAFRRVAAFVVVCLPVAIAELGACATGTAACSAADLSRDDSGFSVSLLQYTRARAGPVASVVNGAEDALLSWYSKLRLSKKLLWVNRVRKLHKEVVEIVGNKDLNVTELERKLEVDFKWGKRASKLYRSACMLLPCTKGTQGCLKCIAKGLPGFTGFCRWCPASQSCEAAGFAGRGLKQVCSASNAGINSVGQCWAQDAPYQIGDFLSFRPVDGKAWINQSGLHFDDPLEDFPTYPGGRTGMFDLSTGEPIKNSSAGGPVFGFVIAAASDWGSGTGEAGVLSSFMEADKPALTMHLGDIYWVGTPAQFDSNMLGIAPNKQQTGIKFPKGSLGTFFMNGNHEMISGGTGLMKNGFGYTGQKTTYASYQSDFWRFIALDTGYLCYGSFPPFFSEFNARGARNLANETDAFQPDQVFEWLRDVVKIGDASDTRGIVLFTHHQPFSDWEAVYLGTAKQLQELLPEGKQLIWFFGHEHRLAMYDELRLSGTAGGKEFATTYSLFPRMVGNGGFADFPLTDPARKTSLRAWDNRTYQAIPQFALEPMSVGFNGYFKMVVDGPKLSVSYITGKCAASGCDDGYNTSAGTVVAEESFTVKPNTGTISQKFTHLGSELVVVPRMGSNQTGPPLVKVLASK